MMTAAYENPRNVKRVYGSVVFNIKDHKSESFPQVFFVCLQEVVRRDNLKELCEQTWSAQEKCSEWNCV